MPCRLFRPLALILFVLSALTGVLAKFTLEQVMSAPYSNEMTAAEHAGRIAWVFDIRGVRNIWVADAPNFTARQLTNYTTDDGQAIASLRLTPDGRTAVYARGSETNSQGEVADPTSDVVQPHQQVFAIDIDGSAQPRLLGDMDCGEEGCEDIEISPDGQSVVWAARKKIWFAPVSGAQPARQLFYARGDAQEPRWSPDSKHIAFVSDRGDHSLITAYDFGATELRYLAPSTDRDTAPRWSPDGRQIAFIRTAGVERKDPVIPLRPRPFALWVADATTGAVREIWHSRNDMDGSFPYLRASSSFYFAADGRIIFASEQDGWNHLYSISANGGTPQLLTPGNYETEDVSLSPDKSTVFYTANVPTTPEDVDRRHIWRVPAAGGAPQPVTHGTGMEWQPVITNDSAYMAFIGSTATTTAMPRVKALSGSPARRGGAPIDEPAGHTVAQSTVPADFPASQLVVPRQVIFRSEDGFTIHGQLFMPRGQSGRSPALVFIHGGSMRQMMLGFHYMQYYHNAYAENQYLANLGYVVLSVNYRTGIMYGRAFRQPANAGWRGASEYRDIVAAGKYLQSLPYVDPQRVGLWGGSYGGFLTAMGLAKNSDIFAAGVDLHGVHDWSLREGERASEAPDADAAKKLAFESSPDAYVQSWRSPVLLIQGDDDRNVSFYQTIDLSQRLRDQHVPFEQIVFPDEIHDFLMWRSWMRAYAATADFFDRVFIKHERIGVNGEELR